MPAAAFFLDVIKPFGPTVVAEKERQYSHWLKVAEACKRCKLEKSPNELVRIMQMELMGKRREVIVNRVHSCFSSIRSELEYEDFIKDFEAFSPFDLDDEMFYEPRLRTWKHALEYINTLDFKPLAQIKRMMCYEYHTRNRFYMMQRIYTKYQTIRRNMERREIWAWNPKKNSNATYASWYED